MPSELILQIYKDWSSTCELLADSLSRYVPYDHTKRYTDRELEFYDSLSFRYSKALELAYFFFRTVELELDKNTNQYLRDQLLKMEKLNIIESTDQWMEARKLRNKITHSYDPDELEIIYADLVGYAREIIAAANRAKTSLEAF